MKRLFAILTIGIILLAAAAASAASGQEDAVITDDVIVDDLGALEPEDAAPQIDPIQEVRAAAQEAAPEEAPEPELNSTLSPSEVLEHVDNVRAPGPDFVFTVLADQTNKPNAADNVFNVRVRESKKSLVLYLEPVKQRGRVLLMDGPNMWIYIPGTSRSVRISPQQQLVGGVSNADVARVVFSLDYSADKVETVTEDGRSLFKLYLSAKSKDSSYKTVHLYCNAEYEPLRADFFAISGKLLRTAHFEGYEMVLGKMRPMSIRMVSNVDSDDNVVLKYSKMEVKQTPQAHFQPSYLNQLR